MDIVTLGPSAAFLPWCLQNFPQHFILHIIILEKFNIEVLLFQQLSEIQILKVSVLLQNQSSLFPTHPTIENLIVERRQYRSWIVSYFHKTGTVSYLWGRGCGDCILYGVICINAQSLQWFTLYGSSNIFLKGGWRHWQWNINDKIHYKSH